MAGQLLTDYLTFIKNENNYTEEERKIIEGQFRKELSLLTE